MSDEVRFVGLRTFEGHSAYTEEIFKVAPVLTSTPQEIIKSLNHAVELNKIHTTATRIWGYDRGLSRYASA